jgi:hypothetical protein
MICTDFLAGADLEDAHPEILLPSILRFFKFLPGEQKYAFREQLNVMTCKECGDAMSRTSIAAGKFLGPAGDQMTSVRSSARSPLVKFNFGCVSAASELLQ